eukprot:CAMPEP_0196732028 /NCGR_PEP_ID=MMETSP1091-20130531/11537_1 /TAXON_ID=302021 /ORGANISM="Rhodomonas sp., Strain CCMP768" /LENGTH=35 /DNA_ID= /DNA_START= /DNA_END= /DNA_ORIENTATION=
MELDFADDPEASLASVDDADEEVTVPVVLRCIRHS